MEKSFGSGMGQYFGPKTLGFGPLGGGIVGPQSQYLVSSPIITCMHMHAPVHMYMHVVCTYFGATSCVLCWCWVTPLEDYVWALNLCM